VTFGPPQAPHAVWMVEEPRLAIPAPLLESLAAALPGGALAVRQQGSHALSEPLHLLSLP